MQVWLDYAELLLLVIGMREQVPIHGYKLFSGVTDLLPPGVGNLNDFERDRQILRGVGDSVFTVEILEYVLELAQGSSHKDDDLLALSDQHDFKGLRRNVLVRSEGACFDSLEAEVVEPGVDGILNLLCLAFAASGTGEVKDCLENEIEGIVELVDFDEVVNFDELGRLRREILID